mgnify:CR=1 FL=1|tara:strand:- start:238 stop:534 length:297 start_codon:yes stop_codon:yes gene_type:complete
MSTNDTNDTSRTFQQEAHNGLSVCITEAERAMWDILTRLTKHSYVDASNQLDDVEQAAAIARNVKVLREARAIVNQSLHGDGYGNRGYAAPTTSAHTD